MTITVTAVNDAPVAVDDAATTDEDTAAITRRDVLANDTDVDGDTLTVVTAVHEPGATARWSLNGDGTVTFTPAANFNGAGELRLHGDRRHADATRGDVTITVTAVNDAPVAVDDAATTARTRR